MGVIEYFSANHAQLYFLLAGIGIVIELTVMGLSGPLLFISIASFLTGVLVSAGIVTGGWGTEIFVLGVLTAIITLLCWKPLKQFQNKGDQKDTSSDMIGLKVMSTSEISIMAGTIRYSGVDWQARLDDAADSSPIATDTQCEIIGVNGNIMIVRPA